MKVLYKDGDDFNEASKRLYATKHDIIISSGSLAIINAMARDGNRCHCCGYKAVVASGTVKKRISVYTFDFSQKLTVEHDLLRSLGGTRDAVNVKAVCRRCNNLRGNKFAEFNEFKQWYSAIIESGLDPKEEMKKVQPNFSYI